LITFIRETQYSYYKNTLAFLKKLNEHYSNNILSTPLNIENEHIVIQTDIKVFECVVKKFEDPYIPPFLVNDKNTLLVSGNQFAPPEITRNIPTLSKYPLIWGWATSKANWKIIVSLMQDIKKIKKMTRENSYIEYCFWRSGARRSLEGYIDAWDIPLAFIFYQIGVKTLLPAYNLVSNTGGDKHATHTKEFTKWLKFPTNNYIKSESKPIQNIEQDNWYRKNVFEIKFRHVFSTKISWLLDRLGVRKKSRSNLMDRIFFKFY
jgi:hypothetical protein